MRFAAPDLDDPMKYPKAVRRAVAQKRDAVLQAFLEHRERLRPLLPPPLQRLQEMDLSDGLVRSLHINPDERTLRLCLLCGNAQTGYGAATLFYKNIALTPQETSLLCLLAHEESAAVAWDELDLKTDGDSPVFVHRILWNTLIRTGRATEGNVLYSLQPETEFRFGGFQMDFLLDSAARRLPQSEDFITIVQDPDEITSRENDPSTGRLYTL